MKVALGFTAALIVTVFYTTRNYKVWRPYLKAQRPQRRTLGPHFRGGN